MIIQFHKSIMLVDFDNLLLTPQSFPIGKYVMVEDERLSDKAYLLKGTSLGRLISTFEHLEHVRAISIYKDNNDLKEEDE